MYNEKIESLIKAALADGVLTEKEKQVLFKRAEAEGVDLDEFEMVLDARLVELKKEGKKQSSISTITSNKYGATRKCPVCGSFVSAVAGVCQDCGYEFSGIAAMQSSSLLADKIAKIEDTYSNKIGSIQGGTENDANRRWELNKEKNTVIAQTIKLFPIPNTKADLFEFITSMQANMLSPSSYKLVSDAYLTKYNESLIKADALFKGDSMLSQFVDNKRNVVKEYKKVYSKQKTFGLRPSVKSTIYLIVGMVICFILLFILGEIYG